MNNQGGGRIAGAILMAVLAGCGNTPRYTDDGGNTAVAASSAASPPLSAESAAMAAVAPLPSQRTAFDNVDMYKTDAAQHIMHSNADYTFSGALPPMLPAVVVLRITVDQQGKLTSVSVQRSRDEQASSIALASMRRTAYLPMPYNLARGPGRTLTFSETFLFNDDYRFQLRTLAPTQ